MPGGANTLWPQISTGLISTGQMAGPVPQLGFGCGDLYGGARAEDSSRLIRTAFDSGVRYFDVARLYGDGTAEAVLGQALKPVRDQVIIATKAGIEPWRTQYRRRAAHKAAVLLRKAPFARRLIAEPSRPSERYGQFTRAQLSKSVDRSLKALKTDYIDIVFLHECAPADAGDPETLDVMQGLVRAGKARAWGIATHFADSLQIIDRAPQAAAVVQIPSDVLTPNVRRVPSDGRLILTHSALKHALPALKAALAARPEIAARWRDVVGGEIDPGMLAKLLLGLAAQDNPHGVVLFSTSRPQRIQAMASAPPPETVLDRLRPEIERLAGGAPASQAVL
jgi:diketogulonate reductase-like aldo/keto reductase